MQKQQHWHASRSPDQWTKRQRDWTLETSIDNNTKMRRSKRVKRIDSKKLKQNEKDEMHLSDGYASYSKKVLTILIEIKSVQNWVLECATVTKRIIKLRLGNTQRIHSAPCWASVKVTQFGHVENKTMLSKQLVESEQTERAALIFLDPNRYGSSDSYISYQMLPTLTKRDSYKYNEWASMKTR